MLYIFTALNKPTISNMQTHNIHLFYMSYILIDRIDKMNESDFNTTLLPRVSNNSIVPYIECTDQWNDSNRSRTYLCKWRRQELQQVS
jgi:hypothetical protein